MHVISAAAARVGVISGLQRISCIDMSIPPEENHASLAKRVWMETTNVKLLLHDCR